MNSYIAQSPQPSQPSPPSGWAEWGVLGAIVFLVVKEGLMMLKQKDTAESALTSALIGTVTDTNKELRAALDAQTRAIDKVLRALEGMEQRLGGHNTTLVIAVRDELTKVDAKIVALHSRFDKIGLADGHHRKEG